MTTRRGFIQAVAAGSMLVGCKGKEDDSGAVLAEPRPEEPPIWEPEGTEARDVFPYGVRVGDVTNNSAVVLIYTTESADLSSFQLRQEQDGSWVEVQDGQVSLNDGHGEIELTGLEADTAYVVAFYAEDGGRRSQVTRFRTALSDESWRIVRFGATSCLGGNLPWPNLTQAKNERYDFFCLLGDIVYAYADTKDEYWGYWDDALRQDGLYDLFSSCSVISTWDDHEITNNFNWNEFPDAQERFENALWAFRRGLPQRSGNQGQIWRSISYGKVVEVFVLDCRGERRGEEYISREQLDWLKDGLRQSVARFKIILNSVPMTDFESLLGNLEKDDRWQGYPEQREEILEHIESSSIEGVLWITGDFHYGSISRVSPEGKVGSSMYEVMSGPSGSFLSPIGSGLLLTDQYLLAFSAWNYTRFTCNPDTGEVLVQFVGDTGEILDEMSLFI